jgi:uncharacterized DUF497 family protein
MRFNFEWDEEKASSNYKKHKVDFEEATTVFLDPFSMTIPDPEHSEFEARYIDLGLSDKGRLLIVVYTERGLNIRIISCRKASNYEWKTYEKEGGAR